jgi:hypothetical protein
LDIETPKILPTLFLVRLLVTNMAIPLECPCGKSYRIKDAFAGRKVQCRRCGKVLEVPAADEIEIVEEVAGDEVHPDAPDDERVVPAKRRDRAPREPSDDERVVKAKRRDRAPREPSDDEPPPSREERTPPKRPRRRKVARERSEWKSPVAFEKGWFGSTNAGVAGGVLMILIAVAWFVAGLYYANRIYFYPPILLVIGIAAIVKGLLGSE